MVFAGYCATKSGAILQIDISRILKELHLLFLSHRPRDAAFSMPTLVVMAKAPDTRFTRPPRDKVGVGSMLRREPSQMKMGGISDSGATEQVQFSSRSGGDTRSTIV